MKIAPGKMFGTGDGDLFFDFVIIGGQVFIGDRPFFPDSVQSPRPEIRIVETEKNPRKVDGASAHSTPAVIMTHGEGVLAVNDPSILPPEIFHGQLITGKIFLRVAHRPGVEDQHLHPRFAQFMGQHTAGTPAPTITTSTSSSAYFLFMFGLRLPWIQLTHLCSHVPPRISGTAVADFRPSDQMRIISFRSHFELSKQLKKVFLGAVFHSGTEGACDWLTSVNS